MRISVHQNGIKTFAVGRNSNLTTSRSVSTKPLSKHHISVEHYGFSKDFAIAANIFQLIPSRSAITNLKAAFIFAIHGDTGFTSKGNKSIPYCKPICFEVMPQLYTDIQSFISHMLTPPYNINAFIFQEAGMVLNSISSIQYQFANLILNNSIYIKIFNYDVIVVVIANTVINSII